MEPAEVCEEIVGKVRDENNLRNTHSPTESGEGSHGRTPLRSV